MLCFFSIRTAYACLFESPIASSGFLCTRLFPLSPGLGVFGSLGLWTEVLSMSCHDQLLLGRPPISLFLWCCWIMFLSLRSHIPRISHAPRRFNTISLSSLPFLFPFPSSFWQLMLAAHGSWLIAHGPWSLVRPPPRFSVSPRTSSCALSCRVSSRLVVSRLVVVAFQKVSSLQREKLLACPVFLLPGLENKICCRRPEKKNVAIPISFLLPFLSSFPPLTHQTSTSHLFSQQRLSIFIVGSL